MKSSAFAYARPDTLATALAMLGDEPSALPLAGGQSLLTLLNLRLTTTERLVDLSRLAELQHCRIDDTTVTIGAGITHAAIEDGRVPDGTLGLMATVASRIAYRAVRNHGTLGGSVALADPAADWPTCLLALDATALLTGPEGSRELPMNDFLDAAYTTHLAPGEIIEAFRIPRLASNDRWGAAKATRKRGAYSTSSAIAVSRSGRTRLVVAGSAPRATRLDAAATAYDAGSLTPDALTAEIAAADPDADAYIVRCHGATIRQALRQLAIVR